MRIIVATKNKHKFREIESFARGKMDWQLSSLLDFPNAPEIIEDEPTFQGNALKKAKTIANVIHQPILADDSGLCVPALDGRPGVHSARYAGIGATDSQNNQKLWLEIQKIPLDKRQAYYVCAMVLYLPSGQYHVGMGELHGLLIDQPRGQHGFGYDPLFLIPEKNKTLAEIPHEEKITFSHRTLALQRLLQQMTDS